MPVLFFPTWNALRLVLSSGLVPREVACAPTTAGADPAGPLWIELHELPTRESLAALARLGVQALGGTGVPTARVGCWAEMLPLRPAAKNPAGAVLFIGPDRQAARFLGRLRRAHSGPTAIALRDVPMERAAWIACRQPAAHILLQAGEAGAAFEAFTEQSPGVWALCGWEHPLPEFLARSARSILLLRPPATVTALPVEAPLPDSDEYRLPLMRKACTAIPSRPASLPVTLHLAPRESTRKESFWVLDRPAAAEFWVLSAQADERQLRRLSVARQVLGDETRLLVRCADGGDIPTFLTVKTQGYCQDSRLPHLFIPARAELRPQLRPRELTELFGLRPDRLVWLAPDTDGRPIAHAVNGAEFRPAAEAIEYAAPPCEQLTLELRTDPFPLIRCVPISQPMLLEEPEPPIPLAEAEVDLAEPESRAKDAGWLRRSLRKILASLKVEAEKEPEEDPAPPRPPLASSDRRMAASLASPEAIRHGADLAVRRKELESKLFQELPRLGSEERASRWAALATVYTKLGNPGDAAVCWMNAVWESPAPPNAWLSQWLETECQAAKLTESQRVLDRWLSERQPGIGRVVAAYAAVAGLSQSAGDFLGTLPRIQAFLDQQFDDLPLRSAWMARFAAARVCAGDALGLARWRDRVLTRLQERGPALDLDEPSFLRFHGSVDSERFQAARKCLEAVREKVHAWIHVQGNTGRRLQADRLLQWAGLICEKDATSAYADLMLAWGLGCLGERLQSNNWAARARKRLQGIASPGVDPAAHAVLGDLFLHRVKDAQEGRPPKAGIPLALQQRIQNLQEVARFSVDRLREHSQILEPLDHVRAYRGRDLKGFWGSDRLGERLALLAERTDADQLAEEATALLALCEASPTSEVVPRVILTLLEVAPRLEQTTQLKVLDSLPAALEWLESWLSSQGVGGAERLERLNRLRERMLKGAFAVAPASRAADAGPVVARLIQRLLQLGGPIREPLLNISATLFRALRRLGLRNETEALSQFLEPVRNRLESGPRSLNERLGLAISWFAVGNEDAGYQVLHEAGETLYLSAELNSRERTQLALTYAETLGFAPAVIAHGRLCELFERLKGIQIQGATNRYFTLKPLQLVDVVVRSVVTDEFALGPAVRGWLDDDEFLIRGRIHRDLAAVLREEGIG
jgi:hypothetical protein